MPGYKGGVQPALRSTTTIAAVAEADADGTYGAPEAALINELKTKLNALLVVLRNAGIIAT